MLSHITIHETPDGRSLQIDYHYAWVEVGLARVAMPFDPADVAAANQARARFDERYRQRAEAARQQELARLEARHADLGRRIEQLRKGRGGPPG